MRGWLRDCLAGYTRRGYGPWAVVAKTSDAIIGYCGLFYFPDVNGRSEIEIGYRLARVWWGRGYATEAAYAVLQFAFDAIELNRVYANHFADNPASGRVLEKIGMAKEGCQRQHVLWWGEYRDLVCYGITRERFTR